MNIKELKEFYNDIFSLILNLDAQNKITHAEWFVKSKDYYIMKDSNGNIVDSNGDIVELRHIIYFKLSEYYVFTEYNMTFTEALEWMMQSEENICESKSNGLYYKIYNGNLFYRSQLLYFGKKYKWNINSCDTNTLLLMKFKKVSK